MTSAQEVPITPDMQDFSESIGERHFVINGEVYTIVQDLPALTLLNFAEKYDQFQTGNTDDYGELITSIIRMILEPDSAELFIKRMQDSSKPIGLKSVRRVLPWVMEQIGLRPTEPSENSSDGSTNPELGTNSPENALPEGSTSDDSPPTSS